MTTISYAILCYDEHRELKELLEFLTKVKRDVDEIVVVADTTVTRKVETLLEGYKVKWTKHALDNNFAQQKNYLNSQCSGDFIVNLDADELLSEEFVEMLPDILERNPDVDFYWVPRINTVSGLTAEHIAKWGWGIGKIENMKQTKVLDTNSDEYKLLQQYNLIIDEEKV